MFSYEYGVILKALISKNMYERLLLLERTDILLMRFWSFTIEIKWKFPHFLSADFLDYILFY